MSPPAPSLKIACLDADTDHMKARVNSQISPAISISQIDDDAVREIIELYLAEGGYGARMNPWPASELLMPWHARGQCVAAADALAHFAIKAGFDAWRPNGWRSRISVDAHGHPSDEGCELTPETFGYTDRLNRGYPAHYWACIQHGGQIWGVDLTATQYGYQGPVVRVCTASNPEIWAQRRIWQPQIPPALNFDDIVCNRIRVGIDEYALNAGMVQIWDHPDGTLRYARSYAIDCPDQLQTSLTADPDLLLEASPDWHEEILLKLAS